MSSAISGPLLHKRRPGQPHRSPAVVLPPLIKWPGGKRGLLKSLREFVPIQFGTYFEPFFGGGALFFDLRPGNAVLSDLNSHLIETYCVVRDAPEDLINVLSGWENSEESYYQIREYRPRNSIRKAARFLYLTRLSFNGIYRVNLAGEFNVPYGHKVHLTTVDEAQLRLTSKALRDATLIHGDFEDATATARAGDFVYFDPPYTVAHAQNGFIKYNEKIFSWADQERLARAANRLSAMGCHVLVSNADHGSVVELFGRERWVRLERPSVIAADRLHRGTIGESLFIY